MTKQKTINIGQEFTIRTIDKIKKNILTHLKKNNDPQFSVKEIKEVDLAGLQLLEVLDRDFNLNIQGVEPSLGELIKGSGFENLINKTN